MKNNLDELFQEYVSQNSWFWPKDLTTSSKNNNLAEEMIRITPLIQNVLSSSSINSFVNDLSILKDDYGNLIPKSLILKNLMILLDVSAEILDRVAQYCYYMNIEGLSGDFDTYTFQRFGLNFSKSLSNDNIYKLSLTDNKFFEDIIHLLLYASQSNEFNKFDTFESFCLAGLIGNKEALSKFYLTRSIKNSAQIKQLRAVSLGNTLQSNLKSIIVCHLKEFDVHIAPSNRYLGKQQFDLVLYKSVPNEDQNEWKWVVIEFAFQETTNSVIERKAKQAANGLFASIDKANHKLIYIIDGAGFIKRHNVAKTIISYSHFTSTANIEFLNNLIDYLKKYFS